MPYLEKDRRIDSDSRDAGQTRISLNPAGVTNCSGLVRYVYMRGSSTVQLNVTS